MPRLPYVARQTTFFLFPILIIPVLDMESPQRDPRTPPPTIPTTQAGPDATHDELAYHLPILRLYALQISPELRFMSHPTISRHHPYLLVMILSRDAHPGRPYLAVLRCIDTDRITSSMPDYDPQSENQKDSKMSHPLYTQLPHFAVFVRKFYFGTNFTH